MTGSFRVGQRVALLRQSSFTGDLQVIPLTIVRFLDDDRALVRTPSGDEVAFPLASLDPIPDDD